MHPRCRCALLLAVALTLTACEEFPDELSTTEASIVGGEETWDYPPVVAIVFQATMMGQASFCSGTIINDDWVLTAAHCPPEDFEFEYSTIFLGGDIYDDETVELEFDEYHVHPDYNGISQDVAVLHLAEPSPVEGIPINREAFGDEVVDEEFTFVGFGRHDGTDNIDGLKRKADIAVTGQIPAVFYYFDEESMTSNGDSGGPALYDLGDGLRVTGVTSWGGDTYGVSTRPDWEAEWIDSYTGGDSEPWGDDDDDDDSVPSDDDDSGDDDEAGDCSCQQSGRGAPAASAVALLVAAGLLGRRRMWG